MCVLSDTLWRFPPVPEPAERHPSSASSRPAPSADMLSQHPWLKRYMPASASTGGARSSSASGTSRAQPQEASDEAIALAWAALDKKRREVHLEGMFLGDDFQVKVLGGKWTLEHKSTAFDAIAAMARKGLPFAWCRAYNLNVEASFSIRKHGEEAARVLAVEWCKRMQFFYDIYKLADEPDFVYSPAQLSSYEEELEFVEFVLNAGVHDPAWPRAMAIRSLAPSARPKVHSSSGSKSSKG